MTTLKCGIAALGVGALLAVQVAMPGRTPVGAATRVGTVPRAIMPHDDTATAQAEQTAAANQSATAQAYASATELAVELSTAQARAYATATSVAQQTATAGAQQTATAAAQQTSAAVAMATTLAQWTATVAAQRTAAAAAGQTSTAIAGQTATAAAQLNNRPSATATANPTATPTLPVPTVAPPATSTPSPQPTAATSGPAKPSLNVALQPSLVLAGATARIAVSYQPNALVDLRVGLTGAGPIRTLRLTDSRGHLVFSLAIPRTIRLRNGRTTANVSVLAAVGTWHRLGTIAPVLRSGTVQRLRVTNTPRTYVRANITFPDGRTTSLFGLTDATGHVTLAIAVPNGIKPSDTAPSKVDVLALTNAHLARAMRTLSISDMVIGVTPGSFSNCVQTQMIHVAYQANTSLKVVLILPHNKRLTFDARTDDAGNAALPITLRYAKVVSPVRIDVQARDARANVQRVEQITETVTLPPECRAI